MLLLMGGVVACSGPSTDPAGAVAKGNNSGPVAGRVTEAVYQQGSDSNQAADPQAAGPKQAAVELIKQAGSYAEKLDQATIDFSYDLQVREGEKVEQLNSKYRVLLGKDYNFAFAPLDGTVGPRAHAGDGNMIVLSPGRGRGSQKYIVQHGVAAFVEIGAADQTGYGIGGLALSLFSGHTAGILAESTSKAELLPNETLTIGDEKVDCQHGRITTGNLEWDFWIAAGDQPQLRRIVPNLPEQANGTQPELTINVSWDTKTPVADGAFATVDAPHHLLGKQAPALTLPLLDGGVERLADLIGKKVIVLDFWATSCPLCVLGMPTVESVVKEYADRGVVGIAINVGEDPADIKAFVDEKGWGLPIALDPQLEIMDTQLQLGDGLPTSVLIGLDGRVQLIGTGIPQDQDAYRKKLAAEIEDLLARKDLAGTHLKHWQAMTEAF